MAFIAHTIPRITGRRGAPGRRAGHDPAPAGVVGPCRPPGRCRCSSGARPLPAAQCSPWEGPAPSCSGTGRGNKSSWLPGRKGQLWDRLVMLLPPLSQKDLQVAQDNPVHLPRRPNHTGGKGRRVFCPPFWGASKRQGGAVFRDPAA